MLVGEHSHVTDEETETQGGQVAPNPLALENQNGCWPSSPLPPVGSSGPSSLSPSCFQRLTAIQQVLKAQKISFLLRGGVRVLVAMRDTDTGKGLSPAG